MRGPDRRKDTRLVAGLISLGKLSYAFGRATVFVTPSEDVLERLEDLLRRRYDHSGRPFGAGDEGLQFWLRFAQHTTTS